MAASSRKFATGGAYTLAGLVLVALGLVAGLAVGRTPAPATLRPATPVGDLT